MSRSLVMYSSWFTNDSALASRLRAADWRYERALSEARDLALAEKVSAYRKAKELRDAEYRIIIEGEAV
jgi:hypothetical protein